MTTPLSASGPRFLSCDWGTSTFRLRLVDVAGRQVIAGRRGDEGIAATHAAWQRAGGNADARELHFRRVLAGHVTALAATTGSSLAGIPLVISGMASSSIGWQELPYGALPLALDGSSVVTQSIAARDDLPHPALLISGVRSRDEVMRGEETQLIGAGALGMAGSPVDASRHRLVFPGTHSKHVEVRAGAAVAFQTYMTGEFFELLATKSVLANSVSAGSLLSERENLSGFTAGVHAGAAGNVLNTAFRVRTRALLDHAAPGENYHYLSGVLIGAEIGGLVADDAPLTLVGSGPLLAAYQEAFQILGRRGPLATLDADDALTAGQITIAQRLALL